MNTIIILGAKYLYLLSIAIAGVYFLMRSDKKRFAIFSAIDLSAVYAVGRLAGALYYNPRPFVSEHIIPLISHAADNGFPSDHTLLTAALASIVYCYNRRIGMALFAIAILVGVSRVSAGIHHWIDIAGSVFIAAVVTFIVARYPSEHFWGKVVRP